MKTRFKMMYAMLIIVVPLFSAAGFARTLADYAQLADAPKGAWKYSERPIRIFSPRESIDDPARMIEEARQFHATSIRWVYLSHSFDPQSCDPAPLKQFGQKLKAAGLVWGGAANSGRVGEPYGRDRTYLGQYRNYCDTTSDAYRQYVAKDIQRYLDGGAVQIQFDDPGRTYDGVLYANGGGFSPTAMTKFAAYLKENAKADQLEKWNIPQQDGTLDFAAFVADKGGPKAVKAEYAELWSMFTDFHAEQLHEFYADLKNQAKAYAEKIGYKGEVIFTCNNTSMNYTEGVPYGFASFDYFLGETSARYTPQTVQAYYNTIRAANVSGKAQYFLASNDWYCVSENWSQQDVRIPYRFSNPAIDAALNRFVRAIDSAANDPAKILSARKTLEKTIPRSLVEAIMIMPDWRDRIGSDEPIDPLGRRLYVQRSRRLIALSYSLGSATLVPYDRWIRGYDGIAHGVRFFGTTDEFGDLYKFIEDNAALYDDHEEVFVTGDTLEQDYRAASLPATAPVILEGGSGDLVASVRAKPGDAEAGIVVHMVDWKADCTDPVNAGRKPFTIKLTNAMFAGDATAPLTMTLLIPGAEPATMTGTLTDDGYTVFEIPTLNPYGVLTTVAP